MGDKSPKAKDRAKKQMVNKSEQKREAARAKANKMAPPKKP
jgi:hypothetical protein